MNTLKINYKKNFSWENENDKKSIQELLCNNKIGIGTTDTIPGFFAPLTEEAYQRLSLLKEERHNKPFLVLTALSKIDFFVDLALLDPGFLNIIHNCFPGPLTLVFKARASLPVWMTSQENTIALRCPRHEGIQTLLHSIDGLFSTSANRSNRPSPTTLNDIEESILQKVDFVIQSHKTNETPISHSTIVDCTHSQPLLLREGAFPFSEVLYYYDRAKNDVSLE